MQDYTKWSKADLLAECQRLAKEREDLIPNVVKLGLSKSWCPQMFVAIRALGMGDELPPLYVVQYSNGYGRRQWMDYGCGFLTKEEAERSAGSYYRAHGRNVRVVLRRPGQRLKVCATYGN